jgi:hypothetical protein
MIRTGIYNRDQLERGAFKDIFGKEKNISIYLYQQISQIENIEERTKYTELILNRFNSDRNVIKRTYKNRFNKFDDLSITKISGQNYDKLSILDVAISDGRASCFFLEQSINQLQNFCYIGSDIQINYYLNKEHENSKSYIITDENNKVVEITKPPFVWNLARIEGNFYFINNFLKNVFLKKTEEDLLKNKFKYQEKIELIHPDFRNLLEKSNCFQIRNYNLFDEIPEEYNVIRAMNILHPGYFSKDQLSMIFNNIYNGLEMNGLLIEGSNESVGTPVEGAIYTKTETGFILLNEPERPSRIKDFVLAFRHKNLNGQ